MEGVDELGAAAQMNPSGEEWSVGAQHWVAIFAVLFGAWWLWSGTGGTGGGSARQESCRRASAEHVDSEELRRKRLDALRGHATAETKGKPLAEAQSKEPVASTVTESGTTFSVTVRGILRGISQIKTIDDLTDSSSVGSLHEKAAAAFELNQGERLRLFFKDEEPKPHKSLGAIGISAGCNLQVMFLTNNASATTTSPTQAKHASASTPANDVAQADVSAASGLAPVGGAGGVTVAAGAIPAAVSAFSDAGSARAEVDAGAPFTVRVSGRLPGGDHQDHMIDGLTSASTVLDFEQRILKAFGACDEQRVRLIFMGKELKDRPSRLGAMNLREGATVQAMFLPLATATTPAAPGESAVPPTLGCVGGVCPAPTLGCAGGVCPTQGSDGAEQSGAVVTSATAAPVSREEAWRAMADLEGQLARATDLSEEPPVRQAAIMLKGMLSTVTHGNNTGAMAFAQTMVPDFSKIWNFEPTREHLMHLLAAPVDAAAAASIASQSVTPESPGGSGGVANGTGASSSSSG
eukprot:TRINITY_DN6453_c0_g1_i1.p1 TRINITY_DN6453_c0_g1~~TRINITY_DN6453_c0_g1_i1.p1  ORF type:complete len:522 (-),score=103.98 TRINITY_DN6453_c0_g1_i1:167-1732(-)